MQTFVSTLQRFAETYLSWSLPKVTVVDVLDVLIITFLFYHVLAWIKGTRAWMLFKGIVVILVFILIAAIFQMNTILWLAGNMVNVALTALVVIFQPELRKALEQLGRKKFVSLVFDFGILQDDTGRFSDKTIQELVKASFEMGKVKTGALIVIEQDIMLTEYERTGIGLDAVLTSQLLINIFEKNTPLHDGAVIVRGDRVVSATCYLPLSDSMLISKELGTRHRAAIGISEVSDALTIIVSEETGAVSIAKSGEIYRELDADSLYGHLKQIQNAQQGETRLKSLQRRLSNVRKMGKKVH